MTMLGRDKVLRDQMMLCTVIAKFNRGEINKNHPLQRKPNQWTSEAMSGLAASVIKGEDIDSIKICEQILTDSSGFILWLIDGLQRLTVLESFKNNVFAMGKTLEMPIIHYQGVNKEGKIGIVEYDLRGKKYKDLPDELKEKFDSYPIDVVKHLECSDEEIAYHISRYNRQTNMNVNQKNILSAWKIAPEIKNLANNRFFKDCGVYAPKEDTKEIFNRIICESIMTMFHLNNWKKSKQMSLYLNENATKAEFDVFENELNRLSKIVDQDTVGQLFNSKNSFIWFAAFHKFTEFGIEDTRFIDFLEEFQKTLHNKTFDEYENKSFDTYDDGKGTKDKKVVMAKLDMLTKLMIDFLHINVSETENNTIENEDESALSFVQKNVDKSATEEDIELYSDMIDDCVKIDSPVYQKCQMALIALMAYACKNEKDQNFESWVNTYVNTYKDVNSFAVSQKVNYTYMKRSFDKYIQKKGIVG